METAWDLAVNTLRKETFASFLLDFPESFFHEKCRQNNSKFTGSAESEGYWGKSTPTFLLNPGLDHNARVEILESSFHF